MMDGTKTAACGPYAYRVSLDVDPALSTDVDVATEVQQTIFDRGCVAGFFQVTGKGDDGRWRIILERPDCESDYHECVYDTGHDGSDKAAIEQLQAEVTEAEEWTELAPLSSNYRVESRTRSA